MIPTQCVARVSSRPCRGAVNGQRRERSAFPFRRSSPSSVDTLCASLFTCNSVACYNSDLEAPMPKPRVSASVRAPGSISKLQLSSNRTRRTLQQLRKGDQGILEQINLPEDDARRLME